MGLTSQGPTLLGLMPMSFWDFEILRFLNKGRCRDGNGNLRFAGLGEGGAGWKRQAGGFGANQEPQAKNTAARAGKAHSLEAKQGASELRLEAGGER